MQKSQRLPAETCRTGAIAKSKGCPHGAGSSLPFLPLLLPSLLLHALGPQPSISLVQLCHLVVLDAKAELWCPMHRHLPPLHLLFTTALAGCPAAAFTACCVTAALASSRASSLSASPPCSPLHPALLDSRDAACSPAAVTQVWITVHAVDVELLS